MNEGFLYIATGEKCIKEACESVSSLKMHMTGAQATLLSDRNVDFPYFDHQYLIDKPKFSTNDKVENITKSPYEKTVYIDSDTYITDDISELFGLLEKFDIAVSHAPRRVSVMGAELYSRYQHEGVSDAFPEMNGGLVIFRSCPSVEELFFEWERLFYEDIEIIKSMGKTINLQDQPSFRCALYNSDARLCVVPPEYNCRFIFPTFVQQKVKILHGRHRDLPSVAEEVNRRQGARIYFPGKGLISRKELNIDKDQG